jgi:hypothetical protein
MFNIDEGLPLTESGAWGEFEGSQFLIAHLTSIRFQRTLAQLQQPHRRKIDAGTMDPQLSKDIVCKAMAKGLLLDWKDVVDKSGEDVPFSNEAALKALTINPEFREFVSEFAQNLENFRQAELEEVGKS